MLFIASPVKADDGYRLWLRYDKITNSSLLTKYKAAIQFPFVPGKSATTVVIQEELSTALGGLFGNTVHCNAGTPLQSTLLCGTPGQSKEIENVAATLTLDKVGPEGFVILTRTTARDQL